MGRPYFLICSELITYNDFAPSMKHDHKTISVAECKAFREGRPCKIRGKCILAREEDTWKIVSSKSWKDE